MTGHSLSAPLGHDTTWRELSIPGAWLFRPVVHHGAGATFAVPYGAIEFERAVGHPLSLGHVNVAVLEAGTLRGVHFGDVPPGQAKYVTCIAGTVWDVVVDLRMGSPAFGRYEAVTLTGTSGACLYLGEGLGHGYVSLEDRSTLVYLCSRPYIAEHEHKINPLDPDLAISWPKHRPDRTPLEFTIGKRDRAAPSLRDTQASGLLPDAVVVAAYVNSLRTPRALDVLAVEGEAGT